MILPDVNVLIYAYSDDAPDHQAHREWLRTVVDSESRFALSDLVLSGFLRIVTNPRAASRPASVAEALLFVEALRGRPNCVRVAPGARHWEIFARLCRNVAARGNLVPDAYLAALAIESGSELMTTDRDFSRFPGLRWRHPLDHS